MIRRRLAVALVIAFAIGGLSVAGGPHDPAAHSTDVGR